MIPDSTFPKEERVGRTGDFKKIYREGASFKRRNFILYLLPNPENVTRIGFSISARNINLSSRRNRIRRLLREAYRRHKEELKRGFDAVIVVRKDVPQPVAYIDIENIFLGMAKDAGLMI